MDLTLIDFGDKKVVINQDSFIIEYKGMKFRFCRALWARQISYCKKSFI